MVKIIIENIHTKIITHLNEKTTILLHRCEGSWLLFTLYMYIEESRVIFLKFNNLLYRKVTLLLIVITKTGIMFTLR